MNRRYISSKEFLDTNNLSSGGALSARICSQYSRRCHARRTCHDIGCARRARQITDISAAAAVHIEDRATIELPVKLHSLSETRKMGCCQSGRHGEVPARPASGPGPIIDGNGAGGGGGQSVTTGNRSGSPSAAAVAASTCISSNRRNDESMDEIRRSYLEGRLKVGENCPLTDRQLYGLIKSWKAINRNMTVTAINMFVR